MGNDTTHPEVPRAAGLPAAGRRGLARRVGRALVVAVAAAVLVVLLGLAWGFRPLVVDDERSPGVAPGALVVLEHVLGDDVAVGDLLAVADEGTLVPRRVDRLTEVDGDATALFGADAVALREGLVLRVRWVVPALGRLAVVPWQLVAGVVLVTVVGSAVLRRASSRGAGAGDLVASTGDGVAAGVDADADVVLVPAHASDGEATDGEASADEASSVERRTSDQHLDDHLRGLRVVDDVEVLRRHLDTADAVMAHVTEEVATLRADDVERLTDHAMALLDDGWRADDVTNAIRVEVGTILGRRRIDTHPAAVEADDRVVWYLLGLIDRDGVAAAAAQPSTRVAATEVVRGWLLAA